MATKKSKSNQHLCIPLQVGSRVFIRTVTSYYTGEVIEVSADEIVLVNAAWIADTGRFAPAMASG